MTDMNIDPLYNLWQCNYYDLYGSASMEVPPMPVYRVQGLLPFDPGV